MKVCALGCFVFVFACAALHAQQSDGPRGHPLTVLNGSGDGWYLPGDAVSISGDGAAEGFVFLGWRVLSLDGTVTSWNEQTEFIMPDHASTVAAVYGKVETWLRCGDGLSKTGLLLPKGRRWPQQRTEQIVRVTFSLGDGAGMVKSHELWWMSKVQVDWFPKPDAQGTWGATEITRCFDKSYMGTQLGRAQAIPKELFTEVETGEFEASVWHESLWTWEQAAEKAGEDEETVAPKVDVVAELGVSSNQSYFISRMRASGDPMPIELKVVDRDDPTKRWNSAKGHSLSRPVYAGESCGDMLGWKLGGDTWGSTYIEWTAEGPNNELITGPSGDGITEWAINDADQDVDTDWLKWKPGKWKIKVLIGSTEVELDQEVGWRTEDFLVIGQIVETHAHDEDAPTYGESVPFRAAVAHDNPFIPDQLARTALIALPAPDSFFGLVEFISWAVSGHGATPQGPFSSGGLLGIGNVTDGHRYWMLQNMLNGSVDWPTAPHQISGETLHTTVADEQYRILHHYQVKFSLTADGNIDESTCKTVRSNDLAAIGPTKINALTIPANFMGWGNAALSYSADPQISLYNSQTNSDLGHHSSYASGRIAGDGQNANWRVFGMDAPWIYSEIICQVNADRSVESSIKTSVDITWHPNRAQTGQRSFNNLNIFKATLDPIANQVNYVRQGEALSMDGQVQPFVQSVPHGTWPTPPTVPSVQ